MCHYSGENDAFEHPFYLLFRHLCMTPEGDQSRRPMLHIIADMCDANDCIGYLLLYFIKDCRREESADESVPAYTDLCNVMQVEVPQQLVDDLEVSLSRISKTKYHRFSTVFWTTTSCSHIFCRLSSPASKSTRSATTT